MASYLNALRAAPFRSTESDLVDNVEWYTVIHDKCRMVRLCVGI